ncbi:MAG TPA: tRNA preQ1(34) S-adenosylmethionine ribosyltransferase-isomerase QueA [Desulfobacteraceae bacterium]|nr:tRNA preQ1(34) S-adenosylmethionine ribosyltransferase-isomerase QueA [Desulfobacteraceae bacterium]
MEEHFQLSAYDYHLPEENIAQRPAGRRDRSRLLVLDCPGGRSTHRQFTDIIDYLLPGDILVINNTRVFPARLTGRKESGGKAEVLLLAFPELLEAREKEKGRHGVEVEALLKSSRRPRRGSRLVFGERLAATVLELSDYGRVLLELLYCPEDDQDLEDLLVRYGQVPLPPYIKRPEGMTAEDAARYQTEYAEKTGSVAAPTAGLHFSDSLLARVRQKGVIVVDITLHVGYGTFAPVRSDDIRDHRIHSEYIRISPGAAAAINRHRGCGGRVWAVGTTTARALEFTAGPDGAVAPFSGMCDMYIYPGYRFRIVDNLITNFHLPQSSLLFLVSALAGRERLLRCYEEAVGLGYRFYSYGDAMAVVTRPCQKTEVG